MENNLINDDFEADFLNFENEHGDLVQYNSKYGNDLDEFLINQDDLSAITNKPFEGKYLYKLIYILLLQI